VHYVFDFNIFLIVQSYISFYFAASLQPTDCINIGVIIVFTL